MAVADGDGGIVVRRLLPLTTITSMFLIGCASALDATRGGEPVSPVSIRQLLDEPETWDGKWVRLEGWFDDEVCVFPNVPCIIENENWWKDPRSRTVGRVGVAFDGFAPGQQLNRIKVVASGRVDSSCYAALQRQRRTIEQAADPSSVTAIDPSLDCRLIPVLDHVIMQAAETQQ